MKGSSRHHVLDELDAVARGLLPEPEALRVDAHLRECAGCRAELEAVRAGQGALAALGVPDLPPSAWESVRARRPGRVRAAWAIAAAAVIAATGLALLAGRRPAPPPVVTAGRISLGALGHVDVEPGSVVRVVSPTRLHLALDRGAIRAVVAAPPRMFVVDTPHARVIDLGCAYEVRVDASGEGLLAVDSGAVALERATDEVVVPAAFACAIGARGAGVPYSRRAPDAVRALAAHASRGVPSDDDVARALAAARAADALTLAHVLPRVRPQQRRLVVAAIQSLGRWPADLDPAAVVALEAPAFSTLVRSLTIP